MAGKYHDALFIQPSESRKVLINSKADVDSVRLVIYGRRVGALATTYALVCGMLQVFSRPHPRLPQLLQSRSHLSLFLLSPLHFPTWTK